MKKNNPYGGSNIDGIMDESDPMRLLIEKEGFTEMFENDEDDNIKEQLKKKE